MKNHTAATRNLLDLHVSTWTDGQTHLEHNVNENKLHIVKSNMVQLM